MTIYFDVDLTLLSESGSLRPGVREALERLREDGHKVYLWSGNGIRWEFVDRYGLRDLIAGCLYKPLYDVRSALTRQGIKAPDFCVDDYSEYVAEFGGMVVSPYGLEDLEDREMQRVYEAVRAIARRERIVDAETREC